jgi:hypothetical protein
LTQIALVDSVKAGLEEFDFLGSDMPCKRDWADRLRPHSWLYVFRNNGLGRALCRLKFRWVPAAKALTGRLRQRFHGRLPWTR